MTEGSDAVRYIGVARRIGWILLLLLFAGFVVGAVVPGLKVLFVVCAVIGVFLILGRFGGGWPTTTTGQNHDAMLRGRPYTTPAEDAERRRR